MLNFERKLTTTRSPGVLVAKNRILSSDNNYHSRKKYTITDQSLKKTLQPRRNTSLPKYLINALKNKKSSLKTIQYTQTVIDKPHLQLPKHTQIDLDNVMDINGKQLSYTLKQAIILFQRQQYTLALLKFKAVEEQVGGLSVTNYYWIGLCQYELNNYPQAVRYLTQALNKQHSLKADDYLKLSDCYRMTNNFLCAISMLDKGIKLFGGSSNLLLKRARMHVITKNYSFALMDYERCLKLDPNLIEAQIQKADMIYYTEGIQQARKQYDLILQKEISSEDKIYVSYRKSLLLLQENKFSDAMKILNTLTPRKCPKFQSQINYYKGIIQSKQGNDDFALLSYQQSINSNTSAKFTSQAKYQKIIILLRRKDYYAAEYELERVSEWSEDLKNLEGLVEGIILILKMKMKKGVDKLGEISMIKGFENVQKSFRAYGLFIMREYHRALVELKSIQGKLCEANLFNQYMIEATLALNCHNFNKCLQLLDLANKLDNKNNHILTMKAICHISLYNSCPTANNNKILLVSQDLLVKVVKADPESEYANYLLAVINYQIQNYQKALDYIRVSIEVSEEHLVKHYYLKAHIKMSLQLYKQAINDLTNALIIKNQYQNKQESEEQIQSVIDECYLYRALCYIMTNSWALAEEDLGRFFCKTDNLKKYQHYLYYFMHIGAADTLLTILQKYDSNQQYLLTKMKCYFLTKQLNNCLQIMNKLSSDNNSMEFDMHCLNSLKQSSSKQPNKLLRSLDALKQLVEAANEDLQGNLFNLGDCLFYCGVILFQMQDYPAARDYFVNSKNKKLENNELQQLGALNLQNQQQYGNSLYFLEEIDYNIGLTYLLEHQLEKANVYLAKYPDFQSLLEDLPESQPEQHFEQFQITPFPIHNRLCSIFNPIHSGHYLYRLSFCLPKINFPLISYNKCNDLIKSISINDIPIRPNPPWIKKNQKGIIFTDDLNKQSIDLISEKTQRQKRQSKDLKQTKQKKQYKQHKQLKQPFQIKNQQKKKKKTL